MDKIKEADPEETDERGNAKRLPKNPSLSPKKRRIITKKNLPKANTAPVPHRPRRTALGPTRPTATEVRAGSGKTMKRIRIRK